MKIRTDLKAGARPGQCHKVYNRYGKCKKIVCPYPPFKFPCYRNDLVGSDQFLEGVDETE
jgi:hypothetical protein